MASGSREHVPLSTLVLGFKAARARFDAVEEAADSDEVFIALFEVVAWAGSIGERLSDEERPDVVQALYYVRNAVLHIGADALAQSTFARPYGAGLYGAAAYGTGELTEWAWKPRDSFAAPKSPSGAIEYDAMLDGNSVRATLAAASAELASL